MTDAESDRIAAIRAEWLRLGGNSAAVARSLAIADPGEVRSLARAGRWDVELAAIQSELVRSVMSTVAEVAPGIEHAARAGAMLTIDIAGKLRAELAAMTDPKARVALMQAVASVEDPEAKAALAQVLTVTADPRAQAALAQALAANARAGSEAADRYAARYGLGVKQGPATAVQINVDQRDQNIHVLTREQVRALPTEVLERLKPLDNTTCALDNTTDA